MIFSSIAGKFAKFKILRVKNATVDFSVDENGISIDGNDLGSMAIKNAGTADAEFKDNSENDSTFINLSQKAAALGVATLDADSKIPIEQIRTVLNNSSATTDPTINNDSSEGYAFESLWFNVVTKEAFKCFDASVGAAFWANTTLTIDELGSMAIKNAGTADSEFRTNLQNDGRFAAIASGFDPTSSQNITGAWSFPNGTVIGATSYNIETTIPGLGVATPQQSYDCGDGDAMDITTYKGVLHQTDGLVAENLDVKLLDTASWSVGDTLYVSTNYYPDAVADLGALKYYNIVKTATGVDLASADSISDGSVYAGIVHQIVDGVATSEVHQDPTTALGIATKQYVDTRVNVQTGTTYLLQASDDGKIIVITNASPITLTCPDNIGVISCTVEQGGAGKITPTASGTATVVNSLSHTRSARENAAFGLWTKVEGAYRFQGETE